MDHKCKNNHNWFCYIRSNVVLFNPQAQITDFVKKAYRDIFGVKIGDQKKPFTLNICSKTRVEDFRYLKNGKRKRMLFAIPMVWREGKDLIIDCYFCMINLKRINYKNKHHVQYSDVPSVHRRSFLRREPSI